jgi:hypothetical protein
MTAHPYPLTQVVHMQPMSAFSLRNRLAQATGSGRGAQRPPAAPNKPLIKVSLMPQGGRISVEPDAPVKLLSMRQAI